MDRTLLVTVAGASLMQAACSALLSVLLALPVAHWLGMTISPAARFALRLLPVFCCMSPRVVALCVQDFYGMSGFAGIVVAHAYLNMPFVVWGLQGVYAVLDRQQLQVAQQLGASRWQVYRDVLVPHLRQPVLSMALLVIIFCFSSFSIPLVLGTAPWHATSDLLMFNSFRAGCVSDLLLGLACKLLLLVTVLFAWPILPSSGALPPLHLPLYRASSENVGGIVRCFSFLLMLFLAAPLVPLFWACMQPTAWPVMRALVSGAYDPLLGTSMLRVMINSVLLAGCSSTLAVGIALGVALATVQDRHVWALRYTACMITPILLGSLVWGILCACAARWVGCSAAVVCHALLALPLAYAAITAQLQGYVHAWSQVAASYGASRVYVFRSLVIPLVCSPIMRAWLLCCGMSMGESAASAAWSATIGMTLPMAVHAYRCAGMYDQASVLGSLLMITLLVTSCGGMPSMGLSPMGVPLEGVRSG